MSWQTELENKSKENNMKAFITGWIFVILSIACVLGYIFLPTYWKGLSIYGNLTAGWWLFAAGFFIAGVFFLATTLRK